MHFNRTTTELAIRVHILLMFLLFLTARVQRIEGRKCVCTSKACKSTGVDTCKTKFFCYTELILTSDQENEESTLTRGCTAGATPLLCETKSWVTRSKSNDNVDRSSASWIGMPWPRLKCCDSHDYCNADHHVNVDTWIHDKERSEPTSDISGSTDKMRSVETITDDPEPITRGRESLDQLHRVKPLYVAALVLAIAAVISVLGACYVITRVMNARNPRNRGSSSGFESH